MLRRVKATEIGKEEAYFITKPTISDDGELQLDGVFLNIAFIIQKFIWSGN